LLDKLCWKSLSGIKRILKMLKRIKDRINRINDLSRDLREILRGVSKMREALGRIESRQIEARESQSLSKSEFRVFSQWGEDGMIHFLLDNIKNVPRRVFIEFGVESYKECNTRFLLIDKNWSGLVMDGALKNIESIRKDPIYWQHNLKAIHAFIDRENINEVISENGIEGEIGLLSIDIDGNDYWVWESIDVVSPAIVIAEYNHRFGCDRAVTVPYDKTFVRAAAHYSMIYYGASLKALCLLADRKGYAFVGCNTAGNNAFFVRRDLMTPRLQELTPERGFVPGQFRESRDEEGRLAFLSATEEQAILDALPLVDVAAR
jgi:hypothetical protein